MASVNKVILVGNLGRDPETRYAPNGDAVCNVTLATTDSWKDKQTGEKKEQTEWHRVVFFGRLAEIAGQYLRKGSSVYVEGALRTRKWQDKETGQDRYTTEIRGDSMQMLGGRGGDRQSERGGDDDDFDQDRPQQQSAPRPASRPSEPPSNSGGFGGMDDDIPFQNPYRGPICLIS